MTNGVEIVRNLLDAGADPLTEGDDRERPIDRGLRDNRWGYQLLLFEEKYLVWLEERGLTEEEAFEIYPESKETVFVRRH